MTPSLAARLAARKRIGERSLDFYRVTITFAFSGASGNGWVHCQHFAELIHNFNSATWPIFTIAACRQSNRKTRTIRNSLYETTATDKAEHIWIGIQMLQPTIDLAIAAGVTLLPILIGLLFVLGRNFISVVGIVTTASRRRRSSNLLRPRFVLNEALGDPTKI